MRKSGGSEGLQLLDPSLTALDHLQRVGAGLLADFQHHRRLPVQAGQRPRLLDAVLDT
jgi:hypothetical protein